MAVRAIGDRIPGGTTGRFIPMGLLAAALAVSGCGAVIAHLATDQAGHSTCASTVHGVVPGPGGRAVSLPITPGRIISHANAIMTARRAAGIPAGAARAKLSSWTEVQAMIQAAAKTGVSPRTPAGLRARPWTPIWVVYLTRSAGGQQATSGGSASGPSSGGKAAGGPTAAAVLVAAASGTVESTRPQGANPSWFAALTNRDPSLGGCPGGSTARLPFGVLTRDEEVFTVHDPQAPGQPHALVSALVTLTTVRALNHVDPALYGGCTRQNCSLRELVWPTILTVRARPGTTLACLPPAASYPPGYKPKQVKRYFTVSVPDNGEIDCGAMPRWFISLTDLAPPVNP